MEQENDDLGPCLEYVGVHIQEMSCQVDNKSYSVYQPIRSSIDESHVFLLEDFLQPLGESFDFFSSSLLHFVSAILMGGRRR